MVLTLDPDGSLALENYWATAPDSRAALDNTGAGRWCVWRGMVWTFFDRLGEHGDFAFLEAWDQRGERLRQVDGVWDLDRRKE